MNPLRVLFDVITYRNQHTAPDPAYVTPLPRGGQTVRDPHIAHYAQARRRRVLREGLDPLDRALLDAHTLNLLRATKAHIAATEVTW